MKRIRIIICIIAVICTSYVSALGKEVVYSGRVLNAADSTIVEQAICKLIADGQDVMVGHTNAQGLFELKSDVSKKMTLVVAKKGFIDSEVMLPESKKSINIGDIYLFKGTTLDEVTVTAQTVVHSKGKSIVYPSESTVEAATDAFSLIQQLPLLGLQPNPLNKTFTVNGGTPYIMIDGIPASMLELQNLNPKDILRVDFSRELPMRYAGMGYTGMLEITLKKRNDGGSMRLNAGANVITLHRFDGSANVEYHQGPSQFNINYSDNYNNKYYKDFKIENISTQKFISPDYNVELSNIAKSKLRYNTQALNAKYNYHPNDKLLLSSSLNIGIDYNKNMQVGTETTIVNGLKGQNDNVNKFRTDANSYSADIFARYDINKTQGFEAQIVGTLNDSDNEAVRSYSVSTIEDGKEIVKEDVYNNSVNSDRKSLISELNWFKQFNCNGTLKVGYKNSYSDTRAKYVLNDYNPRMSDNINYLFTGWSHQIGRCYYSLSTGMQATWNNVDGTKDRYWSNISRLYGNYQPNGYMLFETSLRYQTNTPSLSLLTDYEYRSTPYLYNSGNPQLRSSQSLGGNLDFQYAPYRFLNIYVSQNFGKEFDMMANIISYEGNGKFLNKPINLKKAWAETTMLAVQVSDLKGFGASCSAQLQYGSYESDTFTNKGWCLSGYMAVWWNHGPFSVLYSQAFPGMQIYSNGRYTSQEDYNQFRLSYNLGKHWSFDAIWMWPFRKESKSRTEINSSVYVANSTQYIRDELNSVKLSITYQGNFGTIFKSGRRSLENRDTGNGILRDSGR